jgi:hypothetical protein
MSLFDHGLMILQWLKQLYKVPNIVFVLPSGLSVWPIKMFEPCFVETHLPFFKPKIYLVGRQLQRVWKEEELDTRDIMCELCVLSKWLQSVPIHHVVRKLL